MKIVKAFILSALMFSGFVAFATANMSEDYARNDNIKNYPPVLFFSDRSSEGVQVQLANAVEVYPDPIGFENYFIGYSAKDFSYLLIGYQGYQIGSLPLKVGSQTFGFSIPGMGEFLARVQIAKPKHNLLIQHEYPQNYQGQLPPFRVFYPAKTFSVVVQVIQLDGALSGVIQIPFFPNIKIYHGKDVVPPGPGVTPPKWPKFPKKPKDPKPPKWPKFPKKPKDPKPKPPVWPKFPKKPKVPSGGFEPLDQFGKKPPKLDPVPPGPKWPKFPKQPKAPKGGFKPVGPFNKKPQVFKPVGPKTHPKFPKQQPKKQFINPNQIQENNMIKGAKGFFRSL